MIRIESLDHEGRGVVHVEGKALFVEGALPGEIVAYSTYKKKPKVEFANVSRMIKESPFRVNPKCASFGTCGGCSMQHLDPSAQVAVKQRVLEDALWHIGRVKSEIILPAIHGPYWKYRQRARFSVKYVEKKGKVLVGFNEKKTRYVTDMAGCEVLPERISRLIPILKELITDLSIRSRLPQIEIASGEATDVMVFRILDPLSKQDEERIRSFSEENQISVFLQPKGIDSIHPFHPKEPEPLHYSLPEYGIEMPFRPSDFTQVNFPINRALVKRAISLLAPSRHERIADLFCGMGNFTLALARHCSEVVGMEGSPQLVRRARQNAEKNGIGNAEFIAADLFENPGKVGKFDKMLIDPPRAGAHALVESLGEDAPSRIVYVSCDPATLARDAGILVHKKGYMLKSAGVVNMFPHTSHVESIALFERNQDTKPMA